MKIASDAGRGMLLQILTHAWSIGRDWNAMFGNMRAWPDAALHEDHRALECARRNDDLARLDRCALIISYQTATGDPSVHDGQSLEQRICENGSDLADDEPRVIDTPGRYWRGGHVDPG